jgi:AcrR family transcriptional regulator
MARPKAISDEHLLDAAHAAFLEQGYGVPVSAIARRAGVSSAAVFLRYSTKDALFKHVLLRAFQDQVVAALPDVESEPDPERALTRLANTMLAFMRRNSGLVLLRAAAGSTRMCASPEDRALEAPADAVAGWFQRQMDAGRFRSSDPRITARIFCATLGHYAMSEAAGIPNGPPVDPDTYIAHAVAFALHGLLPR